MAMAGQNEFAALARIAENGAAFAVAAPDPLTPGHVNVVFRREAEDWWDVPAGERAAVLDLVEVVRWAIAAAGDGSRAFRPNESAGTTPLDDHGVLADGPHEHGSMVVCDSPIRHVN